MGLPVVPAVTSWEAAERAAAVWVRWLGHPYAQTTRAGSDGGIDVAGSGAVAQVKFYTAPIGRPDVQRLYGADEGRGSALYFFTTSSFTSAAVDYADRVGIMLFRLTASGGVVAQSNAARVRLGRVKAEWAGRAWVDPVRAAALGAVYLNWIVNAVIVVVAFVGSVMLMFNPEWENDFVMTFAACTTLGFLGKWFLRWAVS